MKKILNGRAEMITSLLIFCACLFVYLANGKLISSNDSIPNSILAFNWLENHTLYFDALRGSQYYDPNALYGENGLPYFFAEAPNGHLTSAYPIGSAIVSFPLYLLFFACLKLSALVQSGFSDPASLAIDLLSPEFDYQRQFFEKLAGSLLTAFAAVLFYLAVRLKFSPAVAIGSTFIYAFATLNWAVSSQGLWVHTVSNLVLICLMLCLLKANQTQGNQQERLLLAAGCFCGLLPGIRPTSLLFTATVFAYSLITYRRTSIFVFLGSFSFLLNAAWNVHFFGLSFKSLFVGGDSRLLGTSSGSYKTDDLRYSIEAFLGLLFSPSRGFLIYSPIVLFALPGIRCVFRRKADPDERLLVWLTIASVILFFHYCIYVPWWGAITYGSRFFIDILPVVCYLISYFLARLFTANWQQPRLHLMMASGLLGLCLIFSTFVEVVGAFSQPHQWDIVPVSHLTRFWDWQDSQIERHARNLYLKLRDPIDQPVRYVRRLKGQIRKLETEDGTLIQDSMNVTPLHQMTLLVTLKNRGQSPWYGYETGLVRGRTVIFVKFFDANNQLQAMVFPNQLFVKGNPARGESATALGLLLFPEKPGEYRMRFEMAAEQLGIFPQEAEQPTYEIKVMVQPTPSA